MKAYLLSNKNTEAYNLFLSSCTEQRHIPSQMSARVKAYCTHHSAQAMLLHQPEGVLVAGGEVIGLSWAYMTSGHWSHGVDHICQKGTTDKAHFNTVLFQQGYIAGSVSNRNM